MKYKKKLVNIAFIGFIFILLFFVLRVFAENHMPDSFYSTKRETIYIDTFIPFIKFKVKPKSNSVFASSNDKIYACNLLLCGIPLKNVELKISERKSVVPYGIPFGAKIFTQGVMIINVSPVESSKGDVKISVLKKGDIITHANGVPINSNEDLSKIVENSEGRDLNLKIIRNNLNFEANVTPVKSVENIYMLGISVRDSSSGIGTITFCNEGGNLFAGLGHAIRDSETNEIIPLSHGEIMKANIKNVIKPHNGQAGELRGFFESSIGSIDLNNNSGVYGKLTSKIESDFSSLKVAMKQEVKKGTAKIISTVEGTSPKVYDINIDKISFDKKNPNKNISISICDKSLIDKTGGVVQGMSGSPIIQNGMLVGALTHVVSDNPLHGYGIFAETMVGNI